VWTRSGGASFAGLFDIATNSFLAGSGTPDGYNFGATRRTLLSAGYADSLIAYMTSPLGLDGMVSASDYPLAGVGRINPVPVPGAVWLLGSAMAGLATLRRRLA
jgi:hypothetical protein